MVMKIIAANDCITLEKVEYQTHQNEDRRLLPWFKRIMILKCQKIKEKKGRVDSWYY
jgi:hypothetical protein